MTQGGAGPLRPRNPITAIVVTAGRSVYLPKALVCLADQTRPVDRVVLVDAGLTADPAVREMALRCGIPDALLTCVHAPGARNFGRAVAAGLAEIRPAPGELLFLLHDDAYPVPDCLETLARAIEFAPSVSIAGPKQLREDMPDALGEVGVTTSRFGRRMTGAEDGELDQGQYDHREDMLGVGSAGMLVRAEAWAELGGLDPALGPFRDGLDLSRRARLAGYRVIVVPGAVLHHEQATFRGLRGRSQRPEVRRSFRARRQAFVYTQLVHAPLALVPFAIAAAIVSGLGRAIWRLLTKDIDLLLAELLAPLAVLARPERIVAARHAASRTSTLPRAALRPLQTTFRDVRAMHRDRRLARAEAVRLREAPSEVEIAERAALAARRRRVLAVLSVVAALVIVAAFASLLGAGQIVGGALAPYDVGPIEAWSRAVASWLPVGLGSPGPADPMSLIFALASTLSAGHGAVALIVATPVSALLGGWFAAGAATRSTMVRAWATLVWFAAPSLWLSLADGRLGAAVTHAAIPWALLGLARAAGVDRRDTIRRVAPDPSMPEVEPTETSHASGQRSIAAAAGGGLALAIAVAGTPMLAPVAAIGVLLTWATTGFGWRVLIALIPPAAMVLRLADAAIRAGSWRILLADPGLPMTTEPTPLWNALLGWPTQPSVPARLPVIGGVVLALSALIVLAALAALARRGPRSRAVRAGWLLALLGLLAVAAAGRIEVALAGQTIVRPWGGGAVSVIVAGFVLAATCGADSTGAWIGLVGGARRAQAAVLAAVMLAGPGLQLADTVWQWRSGRDVAISRTQVPAIPLIAAMAAASPDRTSTLVLWREEEDILSWRVVRGSGPRADDPAAVIATSRLTGSLISADAAPLPAGLSAISHLVAQVAAGSAEGVASQFAQAGIGFLVVPPDNKSLAAALDTTEGLTRAAETESGVSWRVGGASDEGRPSWLRLVEPDGTQTALPADGAGIPSGAEGRMIVLAEAADPGWRATQGGQVLERTTLGWQQGFMLPPHGGAIRLSYRSDPLALGQMLVFAAMGLVALPLRRRRSEEGES
ncbi:MAG: glycosyltransferase family 2 protein [Bifidobacteriaceae bacterium]|nr:glycosyltransferase family 2 protein [Bifidobacteriaceae bacterium]